MKVPVKYVQNDIIAPVNYDYKYIIALMGILNICHALCFTDTTDRQDIIYLILSVTVINICLYIIQNHEC